MGFESICLWIMFLSVVLVLILPRVLPKIAIIIFSGGIIGTPWLFFDTFKIQDEYGLITVVFVVLVFACGIRWSRGTLRVRKEIGC